MKEQEVLAVTVRKFLRFLKLGKLMFIVTILFLCGTSITTHNIGP